MTRTRYDGAPTGHPPHDTGPGAPALLHLRRLSRDDAFRAINRLHRHHRAPQGYLWAHGLADEAGHLHGVAIVGRPVARLFDDSLTVEVTRLATDGTPNACSLLYGAAWRKARVDHWRIITYTQDGEGGASLRASGWRQVAVLRPRSGWDTPSRPRDGHGADGLARILWEQTRSDAPAAPSTETLRNEIRNEIQCGACGHHFPLRTGRGRPARYCSTACRVRAHRARPIEEPTTR